ncbi:carbohydrate porin [Scytonema hofmannii FACHB-248]|uniref:Carbohydrate porin n=1 Tax=Scytonema hofmannii FACHB-248 TaxID=1842502 RepID=A0ABR8GR63_9CYAN|nr:iron uptake porin [[Scytonema hofmanni] UTEX B 1581]MBD2605248.1 carbohydrate porin [Scytonema hofmannii FACHB-248]
MTKLLWNVFKVSPLVFVATFCVANSALAAEVNEEMTDVTQLSETDTMSQVTSVSQFSDVQPTDWAFQVLQSLVERYGCIAGYPNGTYRGNRAMSRYEFAAGLNACLNRINELIATGTADLMTKEDLETLEHVQKEFSAELATMRDRVDGLEARNAVMQANQFSTTTKLIGEAIFVLSDSFGDNSAISAATLRNNPNAPNRDLDSNATLSERIRLTLNSSFTGKDQLQIRLQVGNIIPNNSPNIGNASTGTNMTRLIFDNNTDNNLQAEKINYAFNLTDAIRVHIDANNGEFWENINTFSPLFTSTSQGAISRYGRFSPIFRQGQGGAGATITVNPNKALSASVGYLAGGRNNTANNPLDKNGLFDGNYAALAQIGFQPTKTFNVGLTYARTYQNGTTTVNGVTSSRVSMFESTGSSIANNPFGGVATTANHYGVQAAFRLTPKLLLNGWYGYTDAEAQNTTANSTVSGVPITVRSGDSATFNYWGASLGLQDIGTKGSVLGFIFGQPPRTTSNDANVISNGRGLRDTDTSYHLEGLYKYQLNDNIAITPGLLVILSPEHSDRNDTIYVGTVRTTFSF